MSGHIDNENTPTKGLEYSLSGNESLDEAVLHAVSAVTNIPLLPSDSPVSSEGDGESLPPLYDAIDPDALTSLSTNATDKAADWQVTFPYAGCKVTVTSTDTILVTERSSAERLETGE